MRRGSGRQVVSYVKNPILRFTLYPLLYNRCSFCALITASEQVKFYDNDWLGGVEQILGIKDPDDWYSVRMVDIKKLVKRLPNEYSKKTLAQQLLERYPDHNWEMGRFLQGRKARHHLLQKRITYLFKGEKVLINARQQAGLKNPMTGYYLELDIYLPSLNLAFEYQDQSHYSEVAHYLTTLEQKKKLDELKKDLAHKKGITLIEIPCWWDGKVSSLVATIKKYRPELLPQMQVLVDPIQVSVPAGFLQRHVMSIPDVGGPMLATTVPRRIDPTNWLIFEKYDGVRGLWNPKDRTFYSRWGKPFKVPQQIIDTMPTDLFLDGELWFGRDNFQQAMKIVLKAPEHTIDWSKFKYMVFDIPPPHPLSQGAYKERLWKLQERFKEAHPYIEPAPYHVCQSTVHMDDITSDIIYKGGEGIILRDPNAPYIAGRSSSFIKSKVQRDAEAQLVRQVGADLWECKLPSGVTFMAAPKFSHFTEQWNPQVGDIVTFLHEGFLEKTRMPLFPTLYRIRHEMAWEDVVSSYREQTHGARLRALREQLQLQRSITKRGYGHWKSRDNCRKFFDEFAKQSGFDPLQVENWLKVTSRQIYEKQGGGILSEYKGSLKRALKASYPEIRFIAHQQLKTRAPHRYWRKFQNRRAFFDKFAANMGFDPLQPDNWYSVQESRIRREGGKILLRYYKDKGGHKQAIADAYPELRFAEEWLKAPITKRTDFWRDAKNCRAWFDEFAKEMSFDPLVAENWYNIESRQLKTKKGAPAVLSNYNSYKSAIRAAYPEVEFNDKWPRGDKKPNGYWKEIENCRAFFDDFAREMNFDPLDCSNWIQVNYTKFIAKKHAAALLSHYHGNMQKAVQAAYPELNFRQNSQGVSSHGLKNGLQLLSPVLERKSRGYWRKLSRAFFDDFANENGFDPEKAENWEQADLQGQLAERQRAKELLGHYCNFKSAVQDAYPQLKLKGRSFAGHKPKGYWSDTKHWREFFDDFAKTKGFDPLSPKNWYSVPQDELYRQWGAPIPSNMSFKKILPAAYPELSFDPQWLGYAKEDYFKNPINCRNWFDKLAKSMKVDPRNPESWAAKLTCDDVIAKRGGPELLELFQGRLSLALTTAYPELKL